MKEAIRLEIGILLYNLHPKLLLGHRDLINVWVSNRKGNWELSWDIGNLDLSVLVAYKLKRNWNARIRLIMVIDDIEDKAEAIEYLNSLINLARLPDLLTHVHVGHFVDFVSKAPKADLNIFGMDDMLKYEFIESMSQKTNSSCLFVKDSGHESILA
jgi:hypothetical protein